MRDPYSFKLSVLDGTQEQIKSRWLMGEPALPIVAPSWQKAAQSGLEGEGSKAGDERELRLLALVGQQLALVARPAKRALHPRPPLPKLYYPSLQGKARTLFTRCLEQHSAKRYDLLRLMAARGYTSHPLDWMPKSMRDKVPEVYQPWQTWLLSPNADQIPKLSEENWEELPAALRRELLRGMLRDDRPQARSLILKFVPRMAAGEREKIIQLLRPGAEQADHECLKVFQDDRAEGVRGTVSVILTHLGLKPKLHEGRDPTEQAKELKTLVEMLELREGRLRAKRLSAKKRDTFEQCMNRLDPRKLAKALDLTPLQLAQTWDFEQNEVVSSRLASSFIQYAMIEECLPLLRKLAERNYRWNTPDIPAPFSPSQRRGLTHWVVQRSEASFWDILMWLEDSLGSLPFPLIRDGHAYQKLLTDIANSETNKRSSSRLDSRLLELGLILDHEGAAMCIDDLKKVELSPFSPALQVLQLNAHLPPRRELPFCTE